MCCLLLRCVVRLCLLYDVVFSYVVGSVRCCMLIVGRLWWLSLFVVRVVCCVVCCSLLFVTRWAVCVVRLK